MAEFSCDACGAVGSFTTHNFGCPVTGGVWLSPEQVEQIKAWVGELVKAGAKGDYGLVTALSSNIYSILDADRKADERNG